MIFILCLDISQMHFLSDYSINLRFIQIFQFNYHCFIFDCHSGAESSTA